MLNLLELHRFRKKTVVDIVPKIRTYVIYSLFYLNYDMSDILKLNLSDIFTLGGNDSIILTTHEVILMQNYPRHSREYSHLRQLAGLYLDSLRKTEPKVEEPNHYLQYNKTKIQLVPIKYRFWLEKNNFAKYFPADSRTYTFIKIDGKIIEETTTDRIKQFVLDDLFDNSKNGDYDFYNYMSVNQNAFTPQFLFQLESSKVEFQKDTAEHCYLYYQNCVVKISANSTEIIDYKDMDGYVWKNQIIQRDYEQTDHHMSEFRHFLWCVSGKNMERYKTIQSIAGWLMNGYKIGADNVAIVINDTVISDNPNGGSGKGLFCQGLAQMKKVSVLNMKKIDLSKPFDLQTVAMDCQILVLDDVRKNFDFESTFSMITEGITLEYKNQPAVKLPLEKSPKLVIPTNYTLAGVGGSHDRRKVEVEFSDYFNSRYKPINEFGHYFFSGWDKTEWQRFDNFMIRCLQVYLQSGLIPCEFDNIEVKKFMRNTSKDFYDYVKDHDFVEFGKQHNKRAIFNKFIEDCPDQKQFCKIRKFRENIIAYCQFYRFEFTEGSDKHGIGEWFMITNPNAKKDDWEIPNLNQDNLF